MLKLILVRHGEAEWPTGGQPDDARALTQGGQKQALSLATQLNALSLPIDLRLVSHARRATETADLLAQHQSGESQPCETRPAPWLYEAGVRTIQDQLAMLTTSTTVALIGHNPSFSALSSILSAVNISMGTANAVVLTHDATRWDAAPYIENGWALEHHLRP